MEAVDPLGYDELPYPCSPYPHSQPEHLATLACLMGLEGLVSKHRDSPYRGGRFDRWVKVKNRQYPAFSRVMDTLG